MLLVQLVDDALGEVQGLVRVDARDARREEGIWTVEAKPRHDVAPEGPAVDDLREKVLIAFEELLALAPETADEARDAISRVRDGAQLADLAAGGSVSYGRTFVASRDMRIATLPIGYADGLSRLLSGRGQVLIRGRRAPILGRVCMDMTMVDVTHLPDVRVGDEAVLIGRQGAEEITADEVAELTGTISYEVLCRIGPRVPRSYRAADSPASAQVPRAPGGPHPPEPS